MPLGGVYNFSNLTSQPTCMQFKCSKLISCVKKTMIGQVLYTAQLQQSVLLNNYQTWENDKCTLSWWKNLSWCAIQHKRRYCSQSISAECTEFGVSWWGKQVQASLPSLTTFWEQRQLKTLIHLTLKQMESSNAKNTVTANYCMSKMICLAIFCFWMIDSCMKRSHCDYVSLQWSRS